MRSNECPICGNQAIGFFRKAIGVTAGKFDCPHCGAHIGTSERGVLIVVLLGIAFVKTIEATGLELLNALGIGLPLVMIASWFFIPLIPKIRNGIG